MPPECPPNSTVTIDQLDAQTWLVRRRVREKDVKLVAIPILEHLPEDPEREKVEARLAKSASRKLPEPA